MVEIYGELIIGCLLEKYSACLKRGASEEYFASEQDSLFDTVVDSGWSMQKGYEEFVDALKRHRENSGKTLSTGDLLRFIDFHEEKYLKTKKIHWKPSVIMIRFLAKNLREYIEQEEMYNVQKANV